MNKLTMLTPGTEYTMAPTFIADERRTKLLTARVVVREQEEPLEGWVLVEYLKDGPKNKLGSSRGRLWCKGDRKLKEQGKWQFELVDKRRV